MYHTSAILVDAKANAEKAKAEYHPSTFKLPQDLEETISKAWHPYLKKDPEDIQIDPHLSAVLNLQYIN